MTRSLAPVAVLLLAAAGAPAQSLFELPRGVETRGTRSRTRTAGAESPQDVCATAYWYQTLPSPRWPALETYAERVKDLGLPAPRP